MKTSDKGIRFIENEEGARQIAYRDQIGIWTIGVGHTGPEVKEGVVWSPDHVKDVLSYDIEKFENAVARVTTPLNQFQWDALVSLTFNIGRVGFLSSSLKRYLDENNFPLAANEFDRWVRGGGRVLPVLVGRRQREKTLFLTGNYGF